MSFDPELASPKLETLMESQDVPECDRDELRRFAEFLARRSAKKRGEQLPPAPDGMREWLAGEDCKDSP